MNRSLKTTIKWGGVALAAPFVLFIILSVLLYVPPVQNWAVKTVAGYASEKTGKQIAVEHVCLSFPLDLSIDGFKMIQRNDSLPQVRDTVADVGNLTVSVRLLPLFRQQVDIDRLDFTRVKMNTADFIHEARVKGTIGRLSVKSHGIDWGKETVNVDDALLKDANVKVELSDTVPPDTSKTPTYWKIKVEKLNVENTTADIHMPGDTLAVKAFLGKAKARNGYFDLFRNSYDVEHFALTDGNIAYNNNFEPHRKGFIDPNHILLEKVAIGIDSLHFMAPQLSLTLRNCAFRESKGIEIRNASGLVLMDSLRLSLPKFVLHTPDSWLKARLDMDMNAFSDSCPGKLKLTADASFAKRDIMRFMDGMPKQFRNAWPDKPMMVNTVLSGNMKRMDFRLLNIVLPSAMKVNASGYAANFTDTKRLKADINFKATAYNTGFLTALAGKDALGPARIPSGIALGGNVKTDGNQVYVADLTMRDGGGSVKAKGCFNMPKMAYTAKVTARGLQLQHFLPSMGMKDFSGDLTVSGRGTNPMSKGMTVDASADVQKFIYDNYHLSGINAKAKLTDGILHASLNSSNDLLDGLVSVDGLINSKKVDATLSADINRADLYKLGLVKGPLKASFCCHFDVATDMKERYMLRGGTSDVTIIDSAKTYRPLNITFDILTDRDTTRALVDCGDFYLNMNAGGGYRSLLSKLDSFTGILSKNLSERRIDYIALRQSLPEADIRLTSGKENVFSRFLKYSGYTFKSINMDMHTSALSGVNGTMELDELTAADVRLDTIRFNIVSDSLNCTYNGQVRNARNNPQYVFNALFEGYLFDRGAGLDVSVYDAKERLGVKLGATASLEENGARLHLLTDDIVLGYKKFSANDDNYLFLSDDSRVSAKLNLRAPDGTGLQVYTDDDNLDALQDVTVSLNDFDLSKITSVLPYLPRITGKMNGDFHAIQTESQITVSSNLSVDKMTYEGCAMGDVSTEFVYMPKDDGTHYIDAMLFSNDTKVATLIGTYHPAGKGVIDAELNTDHLPLSLVNGFIPQQLFGFEGDADGKISIRGSLDKPVVNGEMYLDSTSLVSVPYGVTLRFSNDPVRVVDSKLLFENFEVYGHNDNPLNIYGDIDFADLNSIVMDVRMRAKNYQLINSKENYRSVAFGKAYIDFFGFVRGRFDNLKMRGRLNVLGTTDVAYILRDSPLTTDNQMEGLVKFVSLNDSTQQSVVHPPLTGLDMDVSVNVDQGAHVMCYLNADHSNYIDLMGGGDLRMTYDPLNELRLSGKYTLNNGQMKYALPVIPLKTFTIENGSYIEFTGDIMNPKLNITATEETKATVGTDGKQGRSVLFKCGVVITRTLNDMGLEFTLDAPEDMSLHNELQAMSVEQRGKLAVTMLTTGMYLADGNTGGFSMNSALSSFLQSEINSITGNALRTLDLSFGIDNSTDASGNMHTDYSFKFAKRFWNNRLKIIVGGKVSSGAEDPNQNESFFDNVTFEYRLGDTSNKYLRLFYDNNSYDWLEGTTQEFGVGFTWRKTMQHFRHLLRKERVTQPQQPQGRQPQQNNMPQQGAAQQSDKSQPTGQPQQSGQGAQPLLQYQPQSSKGSQQPQSSHNNKTKQQ